MTLQNLHDYSFDDYLAVEREAIDEKHEFVAGRVYAMTGATYSHNLIVSNVARQLGNKLAERPCAVLTNDMRVRIETADACKYPDIVVLCDKPRFYDRRSDVLTNPSLLVEVLSPATEAYDRGGKFAIYRSLPSLNEYVLVAQDRLSVEVFARQHGDRWLLTAYSAAGDQAVFESVQCTISLSDIYDQVRFRVSGAEDAENSA